AVVLRGAKPVFVDVREDTLNIDERLIESAITSATRAIFPVHYAGVGCEMDSICKVAEVHDLKVVEDAAQGVNAFYRGRALGTLGHLGAYSFHVTKNFIAGEGGALCINSADLLERAEVLREKGTNRGKFIRGEVDKYTWVDVGSSSLPAEIVSAFLLAQLESIDSITETRRRAYDFYNDRLQLFETEGLIRLPVVPEHCTTNYHLFYILLNDRNTRDGLQAFLKRHGIHSTFHYIPLHSSPMGLRLGGREGELPVTESVAGRLLRLPFFNEITEQQQDRVVEQMTKFFRSPQAV
ncbi:MAG: dTDP-4-amino-4,6-dideoxygalactose transaminase, partial [Blastocatellia bacterium]